MWVSIHKSNYNSTLEEQNIRIFIHFWVGTSVLSRLPWVYNCVMSTTKIFPRLHNITIDVISIHLLKKYDIFVLYSCRLINI